MIAHYYGYLIMNESILTDGKMKKSTSVTSVEIGSLQSNYN